MAESLPAGFGVLVTRPRDQAGELADAIRELGGDPIVFPAIEIAPLDRDAVATEARALPVPDITIFISRNAARHGHEFAAGRLAAIGPGTAAALREQGAAADIVPDAGFDSESLLAEPAFAEVRGRNVRIIRGQGGREMLATLLRDRGARVDYLETYVRRLPACSPAELDKLRARWRSGQIDVAIVMSVESLANLEHLLADAWPPAAAGPVLVTPAARVLKELRTRRPGCIAVLAAGPRVDDLVASIATVARTSASSPPQPD